MRAAAAASAGHRATGPRTAGPRRAGSPPRSPRWRVGSVCVPPAPIATARVPGISSCVNPRKASGSGGGTLAAGLTSSLGTLLAAPSTRPARRPVPRRSAAVRRRAPRPGPVAPAPGSLGLESRGGGATGRGASGRTGPVPASLRASVSELAPSSAPTSQSGLESDVESSPPAFRSDGSMGSRSDMGSPESQDGNGLVGGCYRRHRPRLSPSSLTRRPPGLGPRGLRGARNRRQRIPYSSSLR